MKRALFTLLFFLLASPAWPLTYNVGKDGHDVNNTCSEAQNINTPKLTIAAAVACMGGVGGHTVNIKAGTYVEDFDQDTPGIILPSGPSSSQPTIIKRNGSDVVTISCPDRGFGSADDQCIYLINKSNITFDGLTLDCIEMRGVCLLTNGTANVIFKNGRMINAGTGTSSGSSPVGNLGSGAANTNFQFVNSELRGTGEAAAVTNGIYLSRCNNCLVEHSWIHQFGRNGIQLHYETATFAIQNPIVRHNLIENNKTRCMAITTVTNAQIHHNICRNNGDTASPLLGNRGTIYLGDHRSPYTANLYNNTVYGNRIASGGTVHGCIYVGTGQTVIARNNACVGNQVAGVSNNSVGTVGGAITASFNFSSTDQTVFASPSADLSLPPGGSLINAGTNVGLPCNLGCSIGAFDPPELGPLEVGSIAANKLRITMVNNVAPALQASNFASGWSVLRAGVNNPVVSAGLIGTSTIELTLQTDFVTGNSCSVSYSSTTGSLTDSALIGGSLNQRFLSRTNVPCTNNVTGAPAILLTQTHFRIRGLYGTEAAAEWKAATNQAYEIIPDGAARIRLKAKAENGTPPGFNALLQRRVNGGTWGTIPNSCTEGETTAIFVSGVSGLLSSSGITNGEQTTEQLTSSLANATGFVVFSDAWPFITMGVNTEVEMEFLVRSCPDVAPKTVIEYRLAKGDGSTLDVYNPEAIAKLTVIDMQFIDAGGF